MLPTRTSRFEDARSFFLALLFGGTTWGIPFCSLHGQISFAPAVTYPLGTPPSYVVAADVNGDGWPDLVVADAPNGTLSVLTNNGSGEFGSNALYRISGAGPFFGADVNGDGWVDLVLSQPGSPLALVLTNDGTGHFVRSGAYNVGDAARFVVGADVNGDGWVDIITCNNSSLVVLTNNGGGQFIQSWTGGHLPQSVAVTDVNGDGRLDLVEVSATPEPTNSLVILTNAGNGTFVLSSTNLLTTIWAGFVTAADLNGDGKPEVIVPDYDSGDGTTFEILTNNGMGGYGSNATYSGMSAPNLVIPADLDGSGRVDLVASARGPGVIVFTNNGSGIFSSNLTVNGVALSWGTVADVNGDGKPDIIAVGGTISVLFNTSHFPPPTFIPALDCQRSATGTYLQWPSDTPGWSLMQISDLTQTNWTPSGYGSEPIADDGTNKSFLITHPLGSQFFRLLHP